MRLIPFTGRLSNTNRFVLSARYELSLESRGRLRKESLENRAERYYRGENAERDKQD